MNGTRPTSLAKPRGPATISYSTAQLRAQEVMKSHDLHHEACEWGILMRLTSERGVPPLGGVPHQYHIDSHILTRIKEGKSARDGSIGALLAAHNCGSENASSSRVCLCLGARKDLVNPHPKGCSFPSSPVGPPPSTLPIQMACG